MKKSRHYCGDMKRSIISVIIMLSIFFGTSMPTAVNASNAVSDKATVNDSFISNMDNLSSPLNTATETQGNDSVILSNNGKSFVYKLGEVYEDGDSVIVTTEEKTVNISLYDWYAVDYNNTDMYLADIMSVCNPEELGVTGIFVYPAGSYLFGAPEIFDIDYVNCNIIEIVYINQQRNICTKIIAPLDPDCLGEIGNWSESFLLRKDNTDALSKRLIQSYSLESLFKSSMYEQSEMQKISADDMEVMLTSLPDYGNYANSNGTVSLNQYDKYTDSDGYLSEYEEIYKDRVHTFSAGASSSLRASDDPIVNIIPKNLFKVRNTYSYIGKEYGFYVRSIQDYADDNLCEFIIFDIDTVQPYPGRADDAPPSVTIRPVSSGLIRYIASGGGIVVYDSYLDSHLALANIQVTGSINNIFEKNIGDSGYVASQDYGYAFVSYAVEVVGTGKASDSSHVDLGYVKMALGAATKLNNLYPGVGTTVSIVGKAVTSIIELVFNHYYSSNRTTYTEMDKLADGNYKTNMVTLGNSNTVSMINNYGNLIKGFETELLDPGKVKEEEYPLLYKTDSHYFTVQYSFCQKDAAVNWDALIELNIALDIYYDTTDYWILGTQEFTKRDSVVGGRVDYFNEIPSNSSGGEISESVFYHAEFTKDPNSPSTSSELVTPIAGSYKDFYFTPNRTFVYVIETMNRSPNADPYLKIYDSANNLLTCNDDGGAIDSYDISARNAKITITLTAGQTYRIRTCCYNYTAGYFEFVIRKNNTLQLSSGTSLGANPVVLQNDSIWYSFTPQTTGFYSFYSVGALDTYLSLYDESYSRYAVDDDSGDSLNAHIDMYLLAGKTYYLQVRQYTYGSGTCNVYANMQRVVKISEVTYTSSYSYAFAVGKANFFRFIPDTTRTYTFETNSLNGDPYMTLYDHTMSQIAYNDGGSDGTNSLISYSLEAGEIYYIRIRNLNGVEGYGYVSFSY